MQLNVSIIGSNIHALVGRVISRKRCSCGRSGSGCRSILSWREDFSTRGRVRVLWLWHLIVLILRRNCSVRIIVVIVVVGIRICVLGIRVHILRIWIHILSICVVVPKSCKQDIRKKWTKSEREGLTRTGCCCSLGLINHRRVA